MKVAFVSGCIEYSVCLANALSKHCDIDFFYSGLYACMRDDSILSLLDDSIAKVQINPYRIRDPRNFKSYRDLARRFKEYDVIHIQGGNLWFSMSRYLCRDVPIVCTLHDVVQHAGLPLATSLYQALSQKISISQSAVFIVHGNKLKTLLAGSHYIPSQDIAVIPHGEFSFYKWFRRSNPALQNRSYRRKRLLFFGEVRKNKGLEYLIRAEPMISSAYDDYTICIAGRFTNEPGNSLEYYKSMMHDPSRYEIENRFIGNHEVADLFENSDIIVLPYTSASQSGILPLAYGFAKPVVATDTGSIGEVLNHGQTGFLVPPTDVRALADALLTLLKNDDLCAQFGKNAEASALGRLNWNNIAEKTLDVYACAKRKLNMDRQDC
jgi:glycosyltransferase involved in cell wall biosynthesis